MLPKKYRLASHLIPLVLKKGKRFNSRLFVFVVTKGSDNFCCAIIVPKKIEKQVVVRNKIKRQLSEIVKELVDKVKPGFDVIIMVKKEMMSVEFTLIKSELEKLFKKAGLVT